MENSAISVKSSHCCPNSSLPHHKRNASSHDVTTTQNPCGRRREKRKVVQWKYKGEETGSLPLEKGSLKMSKDLDHGKAMGGG